MRRIVAFLAFVELLTAGTALGDQLFEGFGLPAPKAALQPHPPPSASSHPQVPNNAYPAAPVIGRDERAPLGPTPPDMSVAHIAPPEPASVPADSTGILEKSVFLVSSVEVTGMTVFPESRISPFLRNLIGPAVPFSEIERVRLEILDLYKLNDYSLAFVSANVQAVASRPANVIEIKLTYTVTEGRITKISLSGDKGPAGAQVLRILNHLVGIWPIKQTELDNSVTEAKNIPGVDLKTVLRSDPDEPGGLVLIADVTRVP